MIEPVGAAALLYILTGLASGLLGAVLGLGGGILAVPIMNQLLGVPMHLAVAASLVGVVATSASSSAGYFKRGLPLVRLGLTLELTTVAGALAGSAAAGLVPGRVLQALFALLLLYVAWNMWRGRTARAVQDRPGAYAASPAALVGSGFAGVVSGGLGVGGGVIKVPILNLLVGVPIHRATATSTYMMGMTAAAGTIAFFLRGELMIALTAPLVLGVLVGGRMGPRLAQRIRAAGLRRIFTVVLVFVALRMCWELIAGGGA